MDEAPTRRELTATGFSVDGSTQAEKGGRLGEVGTVGLGSRRRDEGRDVRGPGPQCDS